MAAANNAQVQTFIDGRIRPLAEQVRALKISIDDTLSAIDDIYAALAAQNPTWTDGRTDGPPHLLAGSDVLAINTFLHDIQTAIAGDAQFAIVLKACVRPV